MPRSLRLALAAVLGLTLLFSGWTAASPAHAAEFKLGIDKSIDDKKSSYDVGDPVTYRIRVKCDSLTVPCQTATLTDQLDPNLTFDTYSVTRIANGEDTSTAPISLNRNGNTLDFSIGKDDDESNYFMDGETLEIVISATVTGVPSNAGLTVPNTATVKAQDETATSDTVTITVNKPVIDWQFEKTRVWPPSGVSPAVGTDVTYKLDLYRTKSSGGVPISDATITDTLPAGAQFVKAWTENPSTTGTYSAGKVTFTLPTSTDLSPKGNSYAAYVTVQYPDADYDAGDKPVNTASADVTYNTGETTSPTGTLEASAGVTLADPTPKLDSSKSRWSSVNPTPGGTIKWTVWNHNSGNVTIDDYSIVDTLPAHVHDLTIFSSDNWWQPTSASGEKATFEYSVDGTTWVPGFTWQNGKTNDPQTVPVGMKYVRMTSANLPIDGYTGFSLKAVVDTDAQGGDRVDNCIDTTSDAPATHACANSTVEPDAVRIRPVKTHFFTDEDGNVVSGSTAAPGDTLEWVLGVNTDASMPVDKLTITDVLPKEFELVASSVPCLDYRSYWGSPTSGCASDATEPAYTTETLGDGSTKLTFTDPALPATGDGDWTYQIHLRVQVKDGVTPGDYSNTMSVKADDFTDAVYCGNGDTLDADGTCEASDAVTVARIAAVGIQKWDMGTRENVSQSTGKASASCPDWNGYTRYPCVAQTTPGGTFDYRVKIANQGNVNLTNEVVYDILPYVGDTGVGANLSTSARKSEWTPVLAGPITLEGSLTTAAGHNAVVEYNLTTNPCRPELAEGGSDADWQGGACDSTWFTESQITDWSAVKSYRIKAYQNGGVFLPATRMVFHVPMTAPADSPKSTIDGSTVDLSVAWNSAAQRVFQVNADSSTTRLLPTEPRKVGVIIAAPLVSIGDYVWYDANYNGKQDGTELPAAGVKVTLKDASGNVVATTTTDADGYYGFKDLPEKTAYTLTFDKPSGYDWTRRNKGKNDAIDSDVNPSDGTLSFTTPAWTATSTNAIGHDVADDPTLDAGLIVPRPMVSVGDYTWYDNNRDGVQDAGEPVAAGVTVNLYDADGELLDTTTTDADGYYAFTDLGEDTQYTIEFIRPDGAIFTVADSTGDTSNSATTDLTDSDAPASGASMGKVTFTTGSNGKNLGGHDQADNPGIDAGFIAYNLQLSKVLQTPGLVRLGQTVTFVLTPHNAGPVDALAGWSVSEVLPLQSGLTFVDMDGGAAYDCTTTVGTCVAANPLSRGTDGPAITVHATVDDTATGTLKNVAYISKAPSDIEETNPLAVPTLATDTTGTGTDNDAQAQVLISPLVSIGDFVWYDNNRDGLQGAGEPVYSGMVVHLYDASGDLVATTTTDDAGYYVFANLEANTDYAVEFVKQAGEAFTTQDVSGVSDNNLTTDADDSDADTGTGRAAVTTPATGANRTGHNQADNPTIDAGVVRYNLKLTKTLTSSGPYYEGGTVTYQLVPSNDGPAFALAGWSVTDVLPTGLTLVSMTGTGYTCSGATCTADAALAAGASGAPITLVATINGDFVGSAHNVAYVSPAAGDVVETNPLVVPNTGTTTDTTDTDNDAQADLQVDSLVSIGDYVWWDTNRDGAQGDDEEVVPDVVVNLYAADGTTLVATTTTDANGFYSFTDLVPGKGYVVEFVKPAHTAFTYQTYSGVDAAADSNADVTTGRVSVTAPASGVNSATTPDDPTIDAGLLKLVSVGDFVWMDNNRNGTFDTDEPLEPGITVRLYDMDGNLLATDVTDANGYYGFADLLPGEQYRMHFVQPDGYSFTGADLVDDDADSDADLAGDVLFTTPMSGDNVVTPRGEDDPTIDVGLVRYNLSLTKTLETSGKVRVGDTVTYTLVPHNDGPSWSLDSWTVTDVLPSQLTLVSMEGEGYSCSGTTCTADEPLAAGADGPVITVTAKVKAGAKGTLWNVAYVGPSAVDAVEANPLGTLPDTDTDTADTATDNDDQAPLEITAAAGSLAYTGTVGLPWLIGSGLLLVLLGAALVGARRSRRQA
ncbi:MAG: DUF11 domain-containing protein [Actinobacteria bacterium]|nr:DUF11 domain-containing protein [Actinomycetota bacterium]